MSTGPFYFFGKKNNDPSINPALRNIRHKISAFLLAQGGQGHIPDLIADFLMPRMIMALIHGFHYAAFFQNGADFLCIAKAMIGTDMRINILMHEKIRFA